MNQGLVILLLLSGAVLQCHAGLVQKYLTSKTWSDAQAYCRKGRGDLYAVTGTYGVDFLQNYTMKINNTEKAWIGLYENNNSTWKCSDESNVNYFRWADGQPDSKFTGENCVAFYDGYFYDELCTDKLQFYCYSDTWKRKILQLKVESDQDPEDPAVKTALLLQIQQALKAHGFAKNVTVRLKQRPNGKVFLKLRGNQDDV